MPQIAYPSTGYDRTGFRISTPSPSSFTNQNEEGSRIRSFLNLRQSFDGLVVPRGTIRKGRLSSGTSFCPVCLRAGTEPNAIQFLGRLCPCGTDSFESGR